jgi:N-acetylmuramoyl-L-alanine amidase
MNAVPGPIDRQLKVGRVSEKRSLSWLSIFKAIFLLLVNLCLLLPIFGPATPLHAAEPVFNTVRVNGRNYVNVADFSRYYSLSRDAKVKEPAVILRSKYKTLQLRINSRECSLNNVKIWLNDAPLEYRSGFLLSEVDVKKTLDPVLRPWAVPKKNIKTVMIDPGHGGEDQGARGYKGSVEKKLTLSLSTRVETLLKQAGFRTLMTRRSDRYVSLQDRSELANASSADLFVSIHFNSSKPNSKPRGVETYCLTPVGLSSTGSIRRRLGIGDIGEEAGNTYDCQNMLLAYLVQQKLTKTFTETEDRGVRRARFFVIKATERPSILIECGFLSNPTEEKRIMTSAYLDRLAKSIVEGIRAYDNIMEPPPAQKN